MKNKSFLPLIILFAVSMTYSISSEISDSQKALLESLPPDQRDSVLTKMETQNEIGENLEELYENPQNYVKRPNYEDLEEARKYGTEKCDNCVFGYDFFQYAPTTFAPVNNTPVSNNYILGPGDKLIVNLYGAITKKYESFISREGTFFLPPLGPISLIGMNFGEASELIKERVKRELIGSEASMTLKEVRAMSIYILGEAYQPGKYTMSGLSSVSNALIVSGGMNENGSLRNIQIKRNNKIIATYDFYEFLLRGSLENDVQLQDGDVIFIPFIKNTSRLGGSFKRPGNYEVLDGESVKDIIELAGGFDQSVTTENKVEVSYFDKITNSRLFKSLDQTDLGLNILGKTSINVSSKSGYAVETIKLSGEFENPGAYSIRPGDSILDVLKRAGGYNTNSFSQGAIFLRKSVAKQQKQAFLRSADDLEDTIVDIVTKGTLTNLSEFSLTPISRLISRLRSEEPIGRMVVDLDYLSLKNKPALNFKVQDGDELYIPRRPNSISVVGEVLYGSTLSFDPTIGVSDYINLSGGLKDSADKDKIFIISPNGRSTLVKKSLFSSSSVLIPGSTIVVSRNPRPFDALNITRIVTPILADLATSAAAIAAISD
jgi:protein involved in polysaccharide export with SLBB domain